MMFYSGIWTIAKRNEVTTIASELSMVSALRSGRREPVRRHNFGSTSILFGREGNWDKMSSQWRKCLRKLKSKLGYSAASSHRFPTKPGRRGLTFDLRSIRAPEIRLGRAYTTPDRNRHWRERRSKKTTYCKEKARECGKRPHERFNSVYNLPCRKYSSPIQSKTKFGHLGSRTVQFPISEKTHGASNGFAIRLQNHSSQSHGHYSEERNPQAHCPGDSDIWNFKLSQSWPNCGAVCFFRNLSHWNILNA